MSPNSAFRPANRPPVVPKLPPFEFHPISHEQEHRASPTSARNSPLATRSHRSRASSRASMVSLAQDLHWIGELVNKVTSDATERERRLIAQTEAREQRAAAERQRMAQEALVREQMQLRAKEAYREQLGKDMHALHEAEMRIALLEREL